MNIPIVNGCTCTSCEEAYMGAFKTAWALGVCPTAGDNVLDRDVVKFVFILIDFVAVLCPK